MTRVKVKAITSLVQAYGWQEVIPIYEDTDYGNGLILYLKDAFQEVDIRFPYRSLIHPSSKDSDILEELKKLKAMQSKIFLVHMTASLGSKLFVLVKNSGMMSEGYAWIITQGLSSLLDPIDSKIMDSMQGNTERIIGYWNPKKERLSREADDNTTTEIGAYSISKEILKQPIWPGDITNQPKKLRIGVPSFFGFNEFLKVEWHPDQNDKPKISGFSIDLFHAVLDMLPFPLPHEFMPYVNQHRQSAGTYDELLYQIKLKNFDAVVGDTTIVANRSSYVDFTLPYYESGVSMVVSMKDNEKKNMWIFLKPLSWDLWGKSGQQLVTIYADHMGLYGSHPNTELYSKLNFNVDGTTIET
uniref:Ionotropic glutamate receptor C-terminal domain-containing protein n=1 Tax=Fagus sylvatica TaxID=28930 RepID=A0A2N9HB35_FAGSY